MAKYKIQSEPFPRNFYFFGIIVQWIDLNTLLTSFSLISVPAFDCE